MTNELFWPLVIVYGVAATIIVGAATWYLWDQLCEINKS